MRNQTDRQVILASIALLTSTGLMQAATVTVGTAAPTSFLADASIALPSPIPATLNRYRTSSTLAYTGSSFIHDDGSSDPWQLTSITVRAHNDGLNTAAETLSGLTLQVFQGSAPVAGSTQLGSNIGFGTGTFDATNENFITFNLTPAETAAIGNLSQGILYSFTLHASSDMRFSRLASNANGSFEPYFNGAVRPGGTGASEELVFYIDGTTIPEPSSLALFALGAGALSLRRTR